MLSQFPSVAAGLKKSAIGQVTCKIVLTKMKGEGISYVAAAVIDQQDYVKTFIKLLQLYTHF